MHIINTSTLNFIIIHHFGGREEVARSFLMKGEEDNSDAEDHQRIQ